MQKTSDGNEIGYYLELCCVDLDKDDDSMELVLNVIRQEVLPSLTNDHSRVQMTDRKNARVIVARKKMKYHPRIGLLESEISETLREPALGSFKRDHPQTYEGKGFFTLLTHMGMLFAATLRAVLRILAKTPATRIVLDKYYRDEHTYHMPLYVFEEYYPRTYFVKDENEFSATKSPDGSLTNVTAISQHDDTSKTWAKKASGYYAASQTCFDLFVAKSAYSDDAWPQLVEEAKGRVQGRNFDPRRDCGDWESYIWELIEGDSWTGKPGWMQRAITFSCPFTCPYLVFHSSESIMDE